MLHLIYLIAISAEAASGALMSMRRRMDFFGIAVIGTVAGLGGGSVRDMLLGHYPLGWVAHPEYLLFTSCSAMIAALLANRFRRLDKAFLALDALGLVAFTVIGCEIAASEDVHVSIIVLMGMVTGVFGGLLRDILCNQVPLVLRRDLYATVSLLTGVLYMTMLEFKVEKEIATAIAIGIGFSIRLLAIRYSLALPVPGLEGHPPGKEKKTNAQASDNREA
ncbi:MAG: trimeric intracellular cation channel family protein [Burkholderiaceae bacterium]